MTRDEERVLPYIDLVDFKKFAKMTVSLAISTTVVPRGNVVATDRQPKCQTLPVDLSNSQVFAINVHTDRSLQRRMQA